MYLCGINLLIIYSSNIIYYRLITLIYTYDYYILLYFILNKFQPLQLKELFTKR